MEPRIYKASIFAILYSLISVIFASLIIGFLSLIFVRLIFAIIITLITFLLFISTLLSERNMTVTVTDKGFKITNKNEVDEYNFDECSIKAISKNKDTFYLYVTDSTGYEKKFDLSILGYLKFHSLLDDLRVIGDNSESVTLDAKNK